MDFFDSNEALYAKVKAGATGYDIYVSSSYMNKVMFDQKMLIPLDHSKLPSIKNIDLEFLKTSIDSKMEFSVPYMVTFTGLAYNKAKIKDFVPSWRMFEREDLKGRMTLFNDHRETIGAALKTLGFSYNTTSETEISAAKDLVLKWKKNIAKFDVDEAKRGLTGGEFYLIHAYNGDALQLAKENPDIAFALPEEGTTFCGDDLVIPTTAKNPELAYKFINFLLDAKVCAKNMEFVNYMAPNIEAQKLMPHEFIQNEMIFPPKSVVEKSDMMRDLGEFNVLYTSVWDIIKESNN